MIINDTAGLRRILMDNRVIAVVGLSANETRPSHGVAKYLLDHGYTIIPVNPRESAILGQECYPCLREIPQKVDIVDCFRKAEEIPQLAEEAILIGARVLWMQLGVINPSAAKRASDAGLEVVEDRCVAKEHDRLFGGVR